MSSYSTQLQYVLHQGKFVMVAQHIRLHQCSAAEWTKIRVKYKQLASLELRDS